MVAAGGAVEVICGGDRRRERTSIGRLGGDAAGPSELLLDGISGRLMGPCQETGGGV